MSTTTKMRFEVMQKALPYVAELLDCEALKNFKAEMREKSDASPGDMMQALLTVFLSEKQDIVLGLLGAVSGKTADEIAKQDWEDTKALMADPIVKDVCDFFTFSVRMVRNV